MSQLVGIQRENNLAAMDRKPESDQLPYPFQMRQRSDTSLSFGTRTPNLFHSKPALNLPLKMGSVSWRTAPEFRPSIKASTFLNLNQFQRHPRCQLADKESHLF